MEYKKVDINVLLKNPKEYHNKQISISSYFTVNRNETALYDRKGSNFKGIWISFKEDLQNAEGEFLLRNNDIDNYDDNIVTIKGVFDMNYKGNLGLYIGTLKSISYFSDYSSRNN